MKKTVSLLLVIILMLSFTLTGCDTEKDDVSADTPKGSEESTPTEAEEAGEELSFPLEEQVSLSAFVHTRPNVDNYEENDMTAWLEEMTNIDFTFVVAPDNEKDEKLNLLFATGDYPDLILTNNLNPAMQSLYGGQGVLIPLNDLVEKYGNNTKEVFEQYPVAEDRSTMPDGNIYNLPTVNDCYHCRSTQKMWIYQPWLDVLGLEIPTTTEEFYNVLKAFKEQDPNGNGKADEIPLAGAIKGWEAEVEGYLMNAFVYNATKQNGAENLFVDNGKVAASFANEGWKEGLKYLQMLRKEGLLAKESFTQLDDGLRQMGENPDAVILGAFPGGYPGLATDLSGERWRDYVTVPPLEGPDGTRMLKYDPFGAVQPGASITDACENPDVAFMFLDLLYSQDVTMANQIGPMDTAWKWIDDDSKKGINGEKALWEELIPLADQEPNAFWNQMGNKCNSSTVRLGRYQEDPNNLEVVLYKETKEKYEPYYPSMDILFPPLILTEEQSAELLTYSTTINNYVDEKVAEFVLTDIDVDTAWDEYINELQTMGLEQYLGVYQEAYDAR